MPTRPLALSIRFSGRGWQWPVRSGDLLCVYDDRDSTLLAELPATFLIEMVRHHLTAARLQASLTTHLDPPRLPPAKAVPRLRALSGRRLRGRQEV